METDEGKLVYIILNNIMIQHARSMNLVLQIKHLIITSLTTCILQVHFVHVGFMILMNMNKCLCFRRCHILGILICLFVFISFFIICCIFSFIVLLSISFVLFLFLFVYNIYIRSIPYFKMEERDCLKVTCAMNDIFLSCLKIA